MSEILKPCPRCGSEPVCVGDRVNWNSCPPRFTQEEREAIETMFSMAHYDCLCSKERTCGCCADRKIVEKMLEEKP